MKFRSLIFLPLCLCIPVLSASLPQPPRVTALTRNPNFFGKLILQMSPDRRLTYKGSGEASLIMEIFEPKSDTREPRACFVGIHGGGWTFGDPSDVYPYVEWARGHGMLGISIQYRLHDPARGQTVFDCVKDARSAIRYIREHAGELNIDPGRIVVCGSSAGGHLALACALFDNINDEKDSPDVPCTPNAIVLVSGVADTSSEGFGQKRIGERWRELSPRHHVRSGLPPTLILHGAADKVAPASGVHAFHEAMLGKGNDSVLVMEKGQGHVFMQKDEKFYRETLLHMEAFLKKRAFIQK